MNYDAPAEDFRQIRSMISVEHASVPRLKMRVVGAYLAGKWISNLLDFIVPAQLLPLGGTAVEFSSSVCRKHIRPGSHS
jgi:hypothetical protein